MNKLLASKSITKSRRAGGLQNVQGSIQMRKSSLKKVPGLAFLSAVQGFVVRRLGTVALRRLGSGLPSIAALLLFGGCIKEKHAFTIFPDGSGKVDIVLSRNSFTPSQWHNGETLLPFDFEWYVNNSEGIVAWTEPIETKKKSWRTHRLTAFFLDLNAVRLPVLQADAISKSDSKPEQTSFVFNRGGERCSLQVLHPLALAVVPSDPKFKKESKPQPRDAGLYFQDKKLWEGFEIVETYRMPGKITGQQTNIFEFKVGTDDIFQKGNDPKRHWNVDRLRELYNMRTRNLESGIDPAIRAGEEAFRQELDRAKDAWGKSSRRASMSLVRAVRVGDSKGVKRALEDGADPDSTFLGRMNLMTCLEQAAKTGDLEMIGHLIDHGADPNKRATEYTPLHSASYYGQIHAIELLLKRGAKAHGPGRSVLDIAVLGRQKEATKFWVRNGIQVTDATWKLAKSKAKFDKANRTTVGKEILDWLTEMR